MENRRGDRDRAADKVSVRQQEMLLNYMEAHLALVKNNVHQLGSGSNEKARMFWDKLADNLNSVGTGSKKSGDRWRKYWIDWKFKVRRRHAEDRRLRMRTGELPCKRPKLTAYDLIIIKILGKEHPDGGEELPHATPSAHAPVLQRSSPLEPSQPPCRLLSSREDFGPYLTADSQATLKHSPQNWEQSSTQPHLDSAPQHSPPDGDPLRQQPHHDVEPDIRAWLRRIEERRVEAELITAEAMREQARIQGRLVDLAEEHIPQLSTAFTRIAAALERAVPPVVTAKHTY